MTNNKIFLTGFPGFIASRIIPKILQHRRDSELIALVQEKYFELAKSKIKELETKYDYLKNRISMVKGDLTNPDIIESDSFDYKSITEIFNFAAVYDLRVKKDLAYKVNVEGTKNLINFALNCTNLKKFHHISTCYIAGWATGIFSELDFDKGQEFKNFYEETKFISEKLIRENVGKIPYVIYRPSIVVGDSITGETNKFDGPYPVIFLINRLPKLFLMTQIGSGRNPVNLIHVDYVVDAIAYLSLEEEIYSTYHLCDPNPLTQIELLQLFASILNKKLITIKFNSSFIKRLLKWEFVQNLTGLYPEMIDYFDHNLMFTCDKTLERLEKHNLKPKPFQEYAKTIIDYAIRNLDQVSKQGLW